MIIPLHSGKRSLSALAALLGARLSSTYEPMRLVTRADEVKSGDLFCALSGKTDGHRYTREAAKNGASAILAERKTPAPCPHILVPSVRRALALWATVTLRENPCLRIGITGSVGKTTTKDACAAVFATCRRTHATLGNYNNDLGLPFTVLSMPRETEVLIAELGTNAPGEIAELAAILSPHKSIITRIGHAHIGAFGSLEAIAREKTALFRKTAPCGEVFSMADEHLLDHAALPLQHHYRLTPVTDTELGTVLPLTAPLRAAFTFAYALGRACNIPLLNIRAGLVTAYNKKTPYIECANGIRLIDDTYNASPESLSAALLSLSEYHEGRRVAVLGQMAELGEAATEWHRRLGRLAAQSADMLLLYGAHAKDYADGARSLRGTATVLQTEVTEADALARLLADRLLPKDAVLFKASRSERAEDILSALLPLINP